VAGDAPDPVRPAPQLGGARRDPDFVFVERLELGGSGPAVAVKDSIDIEGFVTRLGSACYAEAPPATRHADVVRALLDAGCRIVGKTNMHELAYGLTGVNGWSGTPLNPRAPKRVPGGSSSGSAVAVAAGLVDFALATDTGGSIRVPAACCGIYGLKPTYGRVSRNGVHPSASTLDCVGPLAAQIGLLERAMSMMEPSFRAQPPPSRARLGWLKVEAEPQLSAAVRAALARADVSVQPVVLASFAAAFGAVVIASIAAYARDGSARHLFRSIAALTWSSPLLNPWYVQWLLPAAASNGRWARYAWWFGFIVMARYVEDALRFPSTPSDLAARIAMLELVTLAMLAIPVAITLLADRRGAEGAAAR